MELQNLINNLCLIEDPSSDKNKRYPLPLLLFYFLLHQSLQARILVYYAEVRE